MDRLGLILQILAMFREVRGEFDVAWGYSAHSWIVHTHVWNGHIDGDKIL
jgi:hypothetical protein